MAITIENKETTRYGTTVTMEIIQCYKCAIPFAVPAEYKAHLRSSKESFYCPNGHPQAYVKSTEEALRERLDQEHQEAERKTQQLKNEIEYRERQIVGLKEKVNSERGRANYHKGKRKVIEARVAHGVCTCCNRTFQDLAKHMASKHPEELVKR